MRTACRWHRRCCRRQCCHSAKDPTTRMSGQAAAQIAQRTSAVAKVGDEVQSQGVLSLKMCAERSDGALAESVLTRLKSEENPQPRNGDEIAETDHNDDAFWPPPRDTLHRTTFALLSLHNLPKRCERRPRFDGSRGACHGYAPELSGASTPPNDVAHYSPCLTLSLHPIGGNRIAQSNPSF
mmetsp:Transcript_35783/g.94010  ORF Transcript_35783/g.94010 Transcript_35783/m.94010 type:complete len:182 (-) Transcript_35783:1326-1871(-)